MTEQAALAKRLFDSERWADALLALDRVASGDTGDDEGNRQIAEYHGAICLERLARHAESAERFRTIAARPWHLKFTETSLWLAKLARTQPSLFRLSDLAAYDGSLVSKFENPHDRELFGTLAYLLGHLRYDEGDLASAELLFAKAVNAPPYAPEAERCLSRVRHLRRQQQR